MLVQWEHAVIKTDIIIYRKYLQRNTLKEKFFSTSSAINKISFKFKEQDIQR